MKKFTFNFGFLDRFKKSRPAEPSDSNEDLSSHSEYDSDESPEDFAEKTLGGFNINKYQKDLQDAANVEENNNETSINSEQLEEQQQQQEEQFKFEEMTFPRAPEGPSKFKFKFPKFNRQAATNKIKTSLTGKSPINSFEKFSWNDFVLRLFSPYTRVKVHGVFVIFLVVVITYMIGKNIALFVNRAPPLVKTTRPTISIPLEKADTTLQDINKITSTNLFNAKESDKSIDTSSKKDIDSIICLDASTPTSLQIKLLDTIVLQDSVKSVASVQVRGSSELMNVREGERLDEMAEVSKINRMKLILKNLQTGDCEYAATETEPEAAMPNLKIVSAKSFKSTNPNIKNIGNSFKIKRTFRDSMITNMSDILTQAKAIQITNPDGSLSFKMTEIVPGSLYSQLDIQENDIIDSINGKKIDNLNELMGLLGRIKEIDQFQIGSKRNGMSVNKEFNFE
ncbi:MAG: hypothetical protein PHY93_04400 [Bacteriovorax sp.]|nr:hypothetical protein [Bacteriovorax sp.]